MSTESQLREKLRKIEALFAGAGTSGERMAAEAALERVRARVSRHFRLLIFGGGQEQAGAVQSPLHSPLGSLDHGGCFAMG